MTTIYILRHSQHFRKLLGYYNANKVSKRMNEVLFEILNNNKNKRVAVVFHATAISYLLKNGVI